MSSSNSKSTPKSEPTPSYLKKQTVIEVFRHTAHRCNEIVALKYNDQRYNWREYLDESTLVARSIVGFLKATGIEPGTRITAIVRLENSPRWMFVHTGLILAGAIPVDVSPIYGRGATLSAIATETEATLLFVDKWDEALYGEACRANPKMHVVVVTNKFDEFEGAEMYITFVEKYGPQGSKAELRQIGRAIKPSDICQVVYGENPTGGFAPKGYMYTHHNVTFVADIIGLLIDVKYDVGLITGSLASHIHEQIVCYYLPHRYGTCMTILPNASYYGNATVDSPSIAALLAALRSVRPTLLFASPSVWDHIAVRAHAALEGACGNLVMRRIRPWAEATGTRGVVMEDAGMSKPMGFGIARLAVLGKVAEELGLDRLRYGAAVGAHLNRETAVFMRKCGIALHSTLGTPETCGFTAISIRGLWKVEFDGVPIFRDVNVQIAHNTGEFVVTGPNVFAGYWRDPELTAKVVDPATHACSTGEVGTYSEGFLRGNGHMRMHYVTSEGVHCDPRAIEGPLKEVRGVKHVLLVGDALPYLTALIVINRFELLGRRMYKGEEADYIPSPEEKASINRILQKEIDGRVNKVFPKELNIVKFVVFYEHDIRREGLFTEKMEMQDRYRIFAKYDQVINKIYGIVPEYEYEDEAKTDEDTKEGAAMAMARANKKAKEEEKRKILREKSGFFSLNVLASLKKGDNDSDDSDDDSDNDGDGNSKKVKGKKSVFNMKMLGGGSKKKKEKGEKKEEDHKGKENEEEDHKGKGKEYSGDDDDTSSTSSEGGDHKGKAKLKVQVKKETQKGKKKESSSEEEDEKDEKKKKKGKENSGKLKLKVEAMGSSSSASSSSDSSSVHNAEVAIEVETKKTETKHGMSSESEPSSSSSGSSEEKEEEEKKKKEKKEKKKDHKGKDEEEEEEEEKEEEKPSKLKLKADVKISSSSSSSTSS